MEEMPKKVWPIGIDDDYQKIVNLDDNPTNDIECETLAEYCSGQQ